LSRPTDHGGNVRMVSYGKLFGGCLVAEATQTAAAETAA
jgi:hypothetical protein